MLGVDKLDRLVSYYNFVHRTVKWWRKVFFWIVEVVVVNSHIIYKEQSMSQGAQPLNHIAYRRSLIDILSEPQRSSRLVVHIPRRLSQSSLERLQPSKHFLTKTRKRRDCVVCSDRSGGKRHLTLYQCTTCSSNPPLCPSICFESYHTKVNI